MAACALLESFELPVGDAFVGDAKRGQCEADRMPSARARAIPHDGHEGQRHDPGEPGLEPERDIQALDPERRVVGADLLVAPVSISSGVSLRASSRSLRHSAMPSMPGSITSATITS